jgi:hypothetical protein
MQVAVVRGIEGESNGMLPRKPPTDVVAADFSTSIRAGLNRQLLPTKSSWQEWVTSKSLRSRLMSRVWTPVPGSPSR